MDTIAQILSIIGCLNWGLVGLFRFDLVAWLFGGQGSLFSRIVYTLVGLAGLWCITFLFRRNVLVDGEECQTAAPHIRGSCRFFVILRGSSR